jgi:hypothetical protein
MVPMSSDPAIGSGTDQFDKVKAKANVQDTLVNYPDVAGLVVRIYFDFRRRNCAPLRFSTLGSDEVGQIGKSFHYPNRRVRCEIGSKQSKVKIRSLKNRAGQSLRERNLIWTAPVKTVMQQRWRRMQFSQNPFVISVRDILHGRR